MAVVEIENQRFEVRHKPLLIASIENPIDKPERFLSYPHLQAWLEVVGAVEETLPNDPLLSREEIYRMLEAKTAKQIAGLFATSSAVILSKLGVPLKGDPEIGIKADERRINEPFAERLVGFIEAAQDDSDSIKPFTRKDAADFIVETLNFISDLPSIKDRPDLVMMAVSDYMGGYYKELNVDNNLSIQGGFALLGLALPKRLFTDRHSLKRKLIEIVKKDSTAWNIFKTFEKSLFNGSAVEYDDQVPELHGGSHPLPKTDSESNFDYFGGFRGFEAEDGRQIEEKNLLEQAADDFLARHR